MDIIKAADQFVGVPYRIHGRDPTAWDCWGCVRYIRQELFGKSSPSWTEAYTALDFKSLDKVEETIRGHMDGWTKTEVKPGAVLLFKTLARDAHVGLYLDKGLFIHAMMKCQTAIVPLEDWKNRLVAAYDTE